MNFFNLILLSISLSIDALGIGISYAIRKINISKKSKIIISLISFAITYISIFLGNVIIRFIPIWTAKLIGSALLIFYGVTTIYQGLKKDMANYDFDLSSDIDEKEALYVGTALAVDSFAGGLSYAIAGYNSNIIPFLVGILQFIFLSLGLFIGKKIFKINIIKPTLFIVISGVIFILLGVYRFLF